MFKKLFQKVWSFLWKSFLALFIFTIAITIVYRFVPIPVTPLMLSRLVEQVSEGKSIKLYKDWESIDNISRNLRRAVVASEDQLFPQHYGFDFKSIEKAMEYNEKKKNQKKKRFRGASTISQQTAKNVFLWQGRSWVRKGLEVYFTVLIELLWSKERILEVYLNVIEMGDGIYGAEAASRAYFNKSAAKLSASEAALITAILPNPRKWSASRPSGYIQARKQWIMKNMNNIGDVK